MKIDRRGFLSTSALVGATSLLGTSALTSSCSGSSSNKNIPLQEAGSYYIPYLPDMADEGRELKVGLIGCGGRGSGAVNCLMAAANGVKITALGDVFPDKIEAARKMLAEKYNTQVADDMCFVGFDAYQKVIDSGVDMVICTTPPVFRPQEFKYATEKGVHSFLEKPIAVDAKGYRSIMATTKQAEAKGLVVITGTQRHHQRSYVAAFEEIQNGAIGRIVGGTVYWNQNQLWYRERQKGWSDVEWMIRDWVNWSWLSGDHIVEQHVHNIDVFTWMTGGKKPIRARGNGARHRRVTGDQYDEFSIDFEYENGVHLQSMCRQVNGCDGDIWETIQGTKGVWSSKDHTIRDLDGNIVWQFDLEAEKANHKQTDPYVLELVDWVNHIRKGTSHVESYETGLSTLAGVMGREAAYTGKTIDWETISSSDMNYLPENLTLTSLNHKDYQVHKPGRENK